MGGGAMKIYLPLALALILAFFTATPLAAPVCGGGHCYFYPPAMGNEGIISASMKIEFTPKAVSIPSQSQDGRAAFAVPQGAQMRITGISTYEQNCIDGASGDALVAVRVIELKGSGVETAGNYVTTAAEVCRCDGSRNVVQGATDNFIAYKFATGGKYSFRIEYATTVNASQWKAWREVDVFVAPGKLEVRAPDSNSVGVANNRYERQEFAKKEFRYWKIKNTGGIDVNITDIIDVGCEKESIRAGGLISGCGFPNFNKKGGHVVRAGETFYLQEDINAHLPKVSPTQKKLSINVLYKDIYGMGSTDLTAGEQPVDVDGSFKIVAQAITPYRKSGTMTLGAGDYNAQVCTDSLISGLYGHPLFALTIKDSAGAEVAVARFHEVASCSDPGSLALLNNEGGLMQFSVPATGAYSWEIAGNVGTAGDGKYRSDFARIGRKFNPTTGLVEDFVLNEHLGPQNIQTLGGSGGPHTFTANVFDRTKQLGPYPVPINNSALSNAGPVIYGLTDVKINAGTGNITLGQGVLQKVSNDSFEISVSGANSTASVLAKTSYMNKTTILPPSADINIFWAGKEKYMLGFSPGPVGFCKDMQGNAIRGSNGAIALSGSAAQPKVKYDWRPLAIAQNECDASNPAYSVCDSAQFSVSLIKKLVAIETLAQSGKFDEAAQLTRFQSYLGLDGFSLDFQKDMDYYLTNTFFDDTLSYSLPVPKWKKYFSDPARVGFAVNGDPGLGRKPHEPGLYNIDLAIEFNERRPWVFFDEANSPLAKVTVNFKKVDSVAPNLLYSLPIDGPVGLEAGGMHRIGYGVGFSGQEIVIFDNGNPQSFVKTAQSAAGSEPLAKIDVRHSDTFVKTTKDSAGQLLLITPAGDSPNSYTLRFAPSRPVPAVIKAQSANVPKGKSISAGYSAMENGSAINAGNYLARLVEIAFAQPSKPASCKDPQQNAALPYAIGTDRQALIYSNDAKCTLHQSAADPSKVYGFNRDVSSPAIEGADASIYLETVFYPPALANSKSAIRNACSTQGAIYLPRYSQSGPLSGYTELTGGAVYEFPAGGIKTLAEAVGGVAGNDLCIAAGTARQGESDIAQSVGLWWNEEKILRGFRQTLAAQPLGLPVNACFGG